MYTIPRAWAVFHLLTIGGAATLCGCQAPVNAQFETAQRLAAQQGKELFVYYESWLSEPCGRMKKAIRSPQVQRVLAGKILCVLDESYEPNQRFVAQYGVDHYPSVVLIHTDKTYHGHGGEMNAESIIRFVESAKPPGRRPMINRQIPRRIDYAWQADYERAFKVAQQENRPVFIFYKSVISGDCTEMLTSVLNRADVASHFDDTVNCMLDWGYPPNRRLVARYGVTNVPAVVIVNPDGTHHARQGRMTPAELISFARSAKSTTRATPSGS